MSIAIIALLACSEPPAVESPIPSTLELDLPGSSSSIELRPFSVRGADFHLQSWKFGMLQEVTPPPTRLFRTTLDTGTTVLAHLKVEGGLEVVLAEPDGAWERWATDPKRPEQWLLNPEQRVEGQCGLDHSIPSLPPPPSFATEAECEHHVAQIAIDADFAYHQEQGSDLDTTVDRVEWILAQVSTVYARDVQIDHELSTLIVREELFYESDDSAGDVLDEFQQVWEAEYSDIERDVAHLMTDRSTPGIAGLAWMGAICTSFQYAWSKDSEAVVAHELGHNWGGGHCDDDVEAPRDNNILCGGDGMWISENTRQIMHSHRDSRDCLDLVEGPIDEALAPYAHSDTVTLTAEDLENGPLSIDVLANDQDGNCEPLSVAEVTSTSARCGEVVSTGDSLVYTPPDGFLGRDIFYYSVTDGQGEATQTAVRLELESPGLELYLPLDEESGDTAADLSGGSAATLSTDFAFSGDTGVFGGALVFDAGNQYLDLDRPDLPPPWTLSLFVSRTDSSEGASVLLSSSDFAVTLEQWPYTDYIGVTEYNVADWTFDAVLPEGEVVHFAMVGDETETRLYLDGDLVDTLPTAIDLPLDTLGTSDESTLRGWVDELRVYDFALDPSELADLAEGGTAEAPQPRSGDQNASTDSVLRWAPAAAAVAYDVYLGDTASSVETAGPSDAEYLGSVEAPEADPGDIDPNQDLYWRVDTVLDEQIITGEVWSFHALDPLRADVAGYWPLDGDPLDHSPELRVGAERESPDYIDGVTGQAAQFSGDGSYIRLYDSNLEAPWTASMWVRRELATDVSAVLMESYSSSIRLEQWNTEQQVGITEYGVADHAFDYSAPIGEWTHLVFVAESEGTQLWVDGELEEEIDGVVSLPQGSIGDAELSADMDEVAVWSRALSESEIMEVYALADSQTALLICLESEPGDTGDTGSGDTGSGYTSPGDTNANETGDGEPDSGDGPSNGGECGCQAGPARQLGWWVLGASLLFWRRRRQAT